MKRFLRIFADLGMVWPFVLLLQRVIEEVKPTTGVKNQDKPTLLALHPDYFRGDLQILADSGRFRVLRLPFKWQYRMLNLYWNEKIDFGLYFSHSNGGKEDEVRRRLRDFLKAVLAPLFSRLKIDCVLSACIWYKQDIEWGGVANEIGVPYVVLHRENLAASRVLQERWENITKRRVLTPKFLGSHIIVHNEIMKRCFIRSGFVEDQGISALGCLRMDPYVNRVKNGSRLNDGTKRVVLFSFVHGFAGKEGVTAFSASRDVGFVRLFDDVHGAIAELAAENGDVEFFIKVKPEGDPTWLSEVEYAVKKRGIDPGKVPNLKIVYKEDAQELILSSSVICGFGSTSLLEAAIAGKPVVFPFFHEAQNPEYSDFVLFRDDLQVFDVARSTEEFKRRIMERVDRREIEPECMRARYALFEKYVSSMNGDSLEQYVSTLQSVIRKGSEAREGRAPAKTGDPGRMENEATERSAARAS
ncbi:MAG: glycosyltransferase family 1 protein [Desulfobacteraceae bacterium]|nr:MAG: glycosyltransferase family 1 protein [Desulfobacteraceae bacterium]